MECKVATNCNVEAASSAITTQKNGRPLPQMRRNEKAQKSVNFTEEGEVKERREKFLTAKYGSHQMSLIRKRLAVEMWLYEELQKLSSLMTKSKELDVDIDQLLDLDDDEQRRGELLEILSEVPSVSDVEKFIDQLLEKMKTL